MQMDQNQEVNQRAVDSGLMEQTEQLASEKVVSSPLIVKTEELPALSEVRSGDYNIYYV